MIPVNVKPEASIESQEQTYYVWIVLRPTNQLYKAPFRVGAKPDSAGKAREGRLPLAFAGQLRD